MMIKDELIRMIQRVAEALADDLREKMAFVGGCTTALHLTDPVTLEGVRGTDDVDLVVEVVTLTGWYELLERLQKSSFTLRPGEEVNCRLRLGELKVDFMPHNSSILGYTNRWYAEGFSNADSHVLPNGLKIRVFSPPFYLGTKLEAFAGRGKRDLLRSKDMEDILSLIDGREELLFDVSACPENLRQYIIESLQTLTASRDMDYAISAAARGSVERAGIIWARLEKLTNV